ncbi:MAG: flagellin lysine-N-methylase [Selenomonadaceae bacterium]|nr:flagellin lysine-N-methylase [Selenomonadaceae bacterium]
MSRFKCDGTKCNAKCCRFWKIIVDKETYKRYGKIRPKSQAQSILSHLKREDDGENYAIMLDDKRACPFLREDKLCQIQKKFGAAYLCAICQTFPRYNYFFQDEGFMERSLSMSCPVAAEMALLGKEPMPFVEVNCDVNAGRVKYFTTSEEQRPLERHLRNMQSACIAILQDRHLSINQRLVVLGFFTLQLEDLLAEGRLQDVTALAQGYGTAAFRQHLPELTDMLCFQPTDYLQQLLILLEKLYGRDSRFFASDPLFTSAVTEAFGYGEDRPTLSLQELEQVFQHGFRDTQKQIINEYRHVMENYLVNEFFVSIYPFRVQGTIAENYEVFLTAYKLTEFILTAMVYTKKMPLEDKALMDFFVHISAVIDHCEPYYNIIVAEVREQNRDLIGYMGSMVDL